MPRPAVGILALQGDFQEHATAVSRCGYPVCLVKLPDDLEKIGWLILPGGESTAIGTIAQKNGLIGPLRKFIKSGKPVWGTCAGLILLADRIEGQKQDGQPSFGGLDVTVKRNFFGSQKQSFETRLVAPAISAGPLDASFIRAPGITQTGPAITILATYRYEGRDIPVAVRQNNLLATSFHTETTSQNLLHQYFLSMA